MKRAFKVLCVLAITISLLGGCAITTIKKPSDFFPFTKGSTWQYKGEGNEYASFSREVVFTLESNENLIVLKAPLEVGTKWEHSTETREIVDVNTTVDTPAGKFENCVVVKIIFPNSTLFEYFKDGVGMVKREFRSGDSQVTSILEKFSVNS
ncbi:MAG: hypothetical protein CVU87_04165 [Firmicutes bacterium HGW-Firmicutes-12]|jgi:hypothetical protein|nr:MAG: hypothetical protein CVU87_04165 [Firmicutes bacterium HGW-Firmicutes-12]